MNQTKSYVARDAAKLLQETQRIPDTKSLATWICFYCGKEEKECVKEVACPGLYHERLQNLKNSGLLKSLGFQKFLDNRMTLPLVPNLVIPTSIEQAFGNAALALDPRNHIAFYKQFAIRAFAPTSVSVFNNPARANSEHFRHVDLQLYVDTVFKDSFTITHPLHQVWKNKRSTQFTYIVPSQIAVCDVKTGHLVLNRRYSPQRCFHCSPVLNAKTLDTAQTMLLYSVEHDSEQMFLEPAVRDFFLQRDRQTGKWFRRDLNQIDIREMTMGSCFNKHTQDRQFKSEYLDSTCPYGRFGIMYGLNFLIENGRTYNDIEKVYKADGQCACVGMEVVHERSYNDTQQMALVFSMHDIKPFGISRKDARYFWMPVGDMLPVRFANMFPNEFVNLVQPTREQIHQCLSDRNSFTLGDVWKKMTNTSAVDSPYLTQAGIPEFDVQCLREVYLLGIMWFMKFGPWLRDNFNFVCFGDTYLRFLAEIYHNPVTGGPRVSGIHVGERDLIIEQYLKYNAARLVHREVCAEREPCGWEGLEAADQFYANSVNIMRARAWKIQAKYHNDDFPIGINPNYDYFKPPRFPPPDAPELDLELLKVDPWKPDEVDLSGFSKDYFDEFVPYFIHPRPPKRKERTATDSQASSEQVQST